jgi:S1-C subfamily serine protease
MLIDIAIVLFALSALYRGREIGFVRQLGSTAGFFGGLFLGAWLEPHTVNLVHSPASRSVVTILTTLGGAFIFLTLGEYLGVRIKRRVLLKRVNLVDNGLGAVLGVLSLLVSAWLLAAVLATLPSPSIQSTLHDSHIIRFLDNELPAAPTVIADLGRLVDPNGFPQVFIGNEPSPPTTSSVSLSAALAAAINRDQPSVVKVEGQGCGGIVTGSGFVVNNGEVATNAHVVAGISQPYVKDSNGTHRATVVWFDPELDYAVLRVNNLAGSSLVLHAGHVSHGTAAAALGYPGGGPFAAEGATVLDEFMATGRDIYGQGTTDRNIYEIQADIIPGNSGGPLVMANGAVIGVVFAQSTTYQHVGYTLTTDKVISETAQAAGRNQSVSTGQCAE